MQYDQVEIIAGTHIEKATAFAVAFLKGRRSDFNRYMKKKKCLLTYKESIRIKYGRQTIKLLTFHEHFENLL